MLKWFCINTNLLDDHTSAVQFILNSAETSPKQSPTWISLRANFLFSLKTVTLPDTNTYIPGGSWPLLRRISGASPVSISSTRLITSSRTLLFRTRGSLFKQPVSATIAPCGSAGLTDDAKLERTSWLSRLLELCLFPISFRSGCFPRGSIGSVLLFLNQPKINELLTRWWNQNRRTDKLWRRMQVR